jgi:tRNA uridine 5-carboxymethylaminomethyl modification enzyme
MAGLNAARRAGGGDALIIDRSTAYIGVMVDDLVTRGVSEPYRMFTSRAEYRLTLRADNADQRLTEFGISAGCVGSERAGSFVRKKDDIIALRDRLRSLSMTPNEARARGIEVNLDGRRRSAFELLAYSHVNYSKLAGVWPELNGVSPLVIEQIEIEASYASYIDRQQADIDAFRRDEGMPLPSDLDFNQVGGLSTEAKDKLSRIRPVTLGQAARIEGMTPGAMSALVGHLKRAAKAMA